MPRDLLHTEHAVITGGGRGIGRLLGEALAAQGMAVSLIARSADELDQSVAAIERAGGRATAAVADVTDEWSMGTALARLRRQFGPIDMLVNNAGIVGPFGPMWEANIDDWWQTMEVNVKGTLIATQLVLPEMVTRRHGRVINMSSHAGVFRWPMVSAYSVSKASIVKFTENLALETSRYGIPVFSVHPGLLQVGMGETIANDPHPEDAARAHVYAWVRREWDEGRGADPAEAVDLLVRLASGRYDALSGRQLSVHDDVDALLDQIDDVRRDDLYVLALKKLPPMIERQRWKSA